MARNSVLGTYLPVSGCLLFGTTTSLLIKLVYELQSEGTGGDVHHFQKPWAMTTVMFMGMSLCLPIAFIRQYLSHKSQHEVATPLLDDAPSPNKWSIRQELRELSMIAVPCCFDLLATVLMNVGLLSVRASVYQMLRGAEMLFAAGFAITLLRRRLNRFHFRGIAFCVAGIVTVGAASTLAGSGGAAEVDRWQIVLGMGLIIAAQAVQAAQLTVEDYFMADLDISPFKVVGYEGLVGVTLMYGLMLPVVQTLPGKDGAGIHEDSWDTLMMLANNPILRALVLVHMCALGMYNMSGMAVTGSLGGVFRCVLETMRTLFVWILDLALFYFIGDLGEDWNAWSWMQLAGFAVLVMGTVTYGQADEWAKQSEVAKTDGPTDEEATVEQAP